MFTRFWPPAKSSVNNAEGEADDPLHAGEQDKGEIVFEPDVSVEPEQHFFNLGKRVAVGIAITGCQHPHESRAAKFFSILSVHLDGTVCKQQ